MEFAAQPLWQPVLEFWLGDGLERDWPSGSPGALWFRADPAVDEGIRERFGTLVEYALAGELVDWESAPLSRLALVLLLDQFPRNIFRGTPQAFAGDHRAVTLVSEGLALHMDRELPWAGQLFFAMPLMHAEDEDLQALSVRTFERMAEQAPESARAAIEDSLAHAREHRDIIHRFGRFPHRNAVLERPSTEEEEAFLENARRYGQ